MNGPGQDWQGSLKCFTSSCKAVQVLMFAADLSPSPRPQSVAEREEEAERAAHRFKVCKNYGWFTARCTCSSTKLEVHCGQCALSSTAPSSPAGPPHA